MNIRSRTPLTGRPYYSGFAYAHDTYNALSSASDGCIYYILSSDRHDVAGRMYVFDPLTENIKFLGDLSQVCGEGGQKVISQGKSHVRFYECDGHLYFATHVGFYEMIDGMERLPQHPPSGFGLYPGGHFLAYDLKSAEFRDLAVAPDGEGIISMTMDRVGRHLYGITWPQGYFLHFDLSTGQLHNLGPISHRGEAGIPGHDYRVLCRALVADPRSGQVYFTIAEGDIFSYHPSTKELVKVDDVHLRLDYVGSYDVRQPGSMAYNWRQAFWHDRENVAYAVHGNSGYLLRFDPSRRKVEIVERLTSEPSRRSGMSDAYTYGYLGFDLGPDQRTLYYLTGGPIKTQSPNAPKQKLSMGGASRLENLHLVTYDLDQASYCDHGPILYPDGSIPTYVNSIALDAMGHVYTLARFRHEGRTIQDLVRIDLS